MLKSEKSRVGLHNAPSSNQDIARPGRVPVELLSSFSQGLVSLIVAEKSFAAARVDSSRREWVDADNKVATRLCIDGGNQTGCRLINWRSHVAILSIFWLVDSSTIPVTLLASIRRSDAWAEILTLGGQSQFPDLTHMRLYELDNFA